MPTYLIGNDGSATLGTSNEHNAHLATWNASFSRQVSDVSGFSDSARRRVLGVYDASGSAGGVMKANAVNTSPGINTTDWKTDGISLTLLARVAVSAASVNACSVSFNAVISDIAISSAKTGDAGISFNFQMSGGAAPTESWDE